MIDLQGIKTLIFDFGGVLINLQREKSVEAYEKLGIKNANELLNNYVQAGIFLDLESGKISKEEFHIAIRKIGVENGADESKLTDQAIDAALYVFLKDLPNSKLEKLKELKSRFRIIMLSNTNAIHFPYCKETVFKQMGGTVETYFDQLYLSYEMGCSKPEKKIFELLLKEEGIKASNCLFFDDGPKNIEVAKSLGFQTYLVRTEEDWTQKL